MNISKLKRAILSFQSKILYGHKITMASNVIVKRCKIEGKISKLSIKIGSNTRLMNCRFILYGSCNSIQIGDNVWIDGAEFICENGTIKIGDDTTCGATQFMARENTSIEIGKDCMLSYNIKILTTDGHPIYNKDGQRINNAKDVTIHDHVWVGNTVIILKGANIPKNSIVGAGSLYTSNHDEEGCIYGGVPAKCLSQEISWSR